MAVKVVTLRGTWSRTNTARYEVIDYRRMMRQAVGRNGGSFDATCHRTPLNEGALDGTFRVSLPVTDDFSWRGQLQVIRSAKKLFEALMVLEMCRPPKVQYTSGTIAYDRAKDQPRVILR